MSTITRDLHKINPPPAYLIVRFLRKEVIAMTSRYNPPEDGWHESEDDGATTNDSDDMDYDSVPGDDDDDDE